VKKCSKRGYECTCTFLPKRRESCSNYDRYFSGTLFQSGIAPLFGAIIIPALVCVSVCLSVTTITKNIVDGFAPNFMRRLLGGKGKTKFVFRYDR